MAKDLPALPATPRRDMAHASLQSHHDLYEEPPFTTLGSYYPAALAKERVSMDSSADATTSADIATEGQHALAEQSQSSEAKQLDNNARNLDAGASRPRGNFSRSFLSALTRKSLVDASNANPVERKAIPLRESAPQNTSNGRSSMDARSRFSRFSAPNGSGLFGSKGTLGSGLPTSASDATQLASNPAANSSVNGSRITSASIERTSGDPGREAYLPPADESLPSLGTEADLSPAAASQQPVPSVPAGAFKYMHPSVTQGTYGLAPVAAPRVSEHTQGVSHSDVADAKLAPIAADNTAAHPAEDTARVAGTTPDTSQVTVANSAAAHQPEAVEPPITAAAAAGLVLPCVIIEVSRFARSHLTRSTATAADGSTVRLGSRRSFSSPSPQRTQLMETSPRCLAAGI